MQRRLAIVVTIAALAAGNYFLDPPSSTEASPILALYESRQSDVVVETSGRVVKVLPDDNRGSRHQKLIVEVAPGHTVLLSHNIDLADRIAGVYEGAKITFRGEYEWNERGGVIHWTHHDPQQRRPGGWVEFKGDRYR